MDSGAARPSAVYDIASQAEILSGLAIMEYGWIVYPPLGTCALPPYLEPDNFALLQARSERVETYHGSFIARLESCASESLDAYILLDAQDWMSPAQLNALWRQIGRTARPAASSARSTYTALATSAGA